MLCQYIASQIYANFAFDPTPEQKFLIEALSDWLASDDQDRIFILNGYAGTGKTSVVGALVRTLKAMEINHVLMAPTGRAAKVMGRAAGGDAYTIHKKIYRQKKIGGADHLSLFDRNVNRAKDTIYIVDEASMLTTRSDSDGASFGSGDLLDDMFTYIRQGEHNRVLLVGDQAQLPPVGYDISPALSHEFMRSYGSVVEVTLSQVMRQMLESGILVNATSVRDMIDSGYADIPVFDTNYPDIKAITGADLIDEIESCYHRYGQNETAIITRSNKRANQYNQGIRRSILDYEEIIAPGDQLMVVKNNYHYVEMQQQEDGSGSSKMEFIANGDVARVRRIYKTRERYGFNFAYAEIEFADYDDYSLECWVLLDGLLSEAPSLTREEQKRLFTTIEHEEYAHITQKAKRYKAVIENEFYCALQVKYAYAFTCHKAQGGQWSAVFVDTMIWGEQPMTIELLRWLYTALTRATERLYLVNFDDRFFE